MSSRSSSSSLTMTTSSSMPPPLPSCCCSGLSLSSWRRREGARRPVDERGGAGTSVRARLLSRLGVKKEKAEGRRGKKMREPASERRSSRSSSSGLSFDFFLACFDLHRPLLTTSLTFSPLPSFPFPTFLPPTPSPPPHSTTNNGQRPRRFHGGSPPRPRRRRGDHERRDGDERCCLFELVVLGVRCCLPCPRQAV